MSYLILFIIFYLLSFPTFLNFNAKSRNIIFFISIIILFLFAGLRYETGGDWVMYTHVFNLIEPINKILLGHEDHFLDINYEFLYKLLNSIVKLFSSDFQIFLLVVQLILSVLLYKSLKEYSTLPIIAVIVYYSRCMFIFDFVVIRQAIAILIVFYSLKYLESKDIYIYIFLVILASFFHFSAIIMLLVSPFLKRTYSNRLLIIYFMVANAFVFFKIRWVLGLTKLLINMNINSLITHKLIKYTADELFSYPSSFSMAVIANLIIFIVVIIYREKFNKFKYFNLFLNLFLGYIFFYYFFFELSMLSKRLNYYFFISIVVLLPMLIDVFELKMNKFIAYNILCIYLLMGSFNTFMERPSSIAYNPYQNYLVYKILNKKSTGYKRFLEHKNKEIEKIRKEESDNN